MRTAQAIRQAANAQVSTADHVPFGSHVRPDVIKLKANGDYIAAWRLEGVAFETADPLEIHMRKESLVGFLRGISGGQFALWTHKLRRKIHERLDARFENAFCQDLSDRYNRSFDTHSQMATELYLTLVYRPKPAGLGRWFSKGGKLSREARRAQEEEALGYLDDTAQQVEAALDRFYPQRLKTVSRGDVVHSELLTLYGFLLNGVWEDVPLRYANLASYLPTSRLHFGERNGLVEIWHPKGRKFAGLLDIQEYPRYSEPGMCNAILYGQYEYVETQSFSLLNRRDGLAALDRQKGQLIASEDVAEREIAEMDQAMDDLQSGLIELGEYHFSLAIFGETPQAVSKSMGEARALLQDGAGFKMAVIDAIPECAWFAQLPGNWSMRPREALLTSQNFAALSPYHNFARGKRDGNPWGEALALFRTPSGQPFYFNFHSSPDRRDVTDEKYPGNTFVCGATGVGKTALEMTLIAFALKYPGLRCVLFDKDRGAEIAVRAMGGQYFRLERGKPTGFNPLQLEPTESNIQFCEQIIRLLVLPAGEGRGLTAREESDISKAVRTVMSDQVTAAVRGMTAVAQNLPKTGDNSLHDRLRKWTRGQPLGWVFDNPRDLQDLRGARVTGFDYTEFLDDVQVRTPIMAYLLHRTEELIDGRPFIYVMEEFWKPLQDDHFADFALNKQKTIRKQGGLGVFVTQSPSDVLLHRIGKTMVEQSVTQIFLPNPKADHDDYVNGFKVTEAEFNLIRNLGETSRLFLVKQGHASALARFDLGGLPDVLNIVSGTTENVELLDEIREEIGDDPDAWLPIFQERIRARRARGKEQRNG
ncbi:VirB4 family type IV secretion/conjugal transfer ATPase [Asticcacaulis sp. W401b]|uniref:VirB4 family type IV secretion/conjugal transfer ATPase n=1 Tax=Asticcacaulis sp. W401b TaxID=3388666 RepID=UPI003970A562